MDDVRIYCCPRQPGVDGLAGGVEEQAGEGQRGRQLVFITELGRSHPVELLDFRKVHLGGDQHTWDVALHVVLLSNTLDKEVKLSCERKKKILNNECQVKLIVMRNKCIQTEEKSDL